MPKVYKYKRVGARKLALTISIVSAILLSLYLLTMPLKEIVSYFLPISILCSVLAYSAYRENYVSVEDGALKIVGTTIPTEKIKKIEVNEKRIDIVVKKGTFLLGTRINMTDACFYSTQDWNDFKQDIEN